MGWGGGRVRRGDAHQKQVPLRQYPLREHPRGHEAVAQSGGRSPAWQTQTPLTHEPLPEQSSGQ